jgi:hypothetical protein
MKITLNQTALTITLTSETPNEVYHLGRLSVKIPQARVDSVPGSMKQITVDVEDLLCLITK